MSISPPTLGDERTSDARALQLPATRCFEMAVFLLLGDFGVLRVGLPQGKPYCFEDQRSFDPVLKSLDHRAPFSTLSSRAKSRDLVLEVEMGIPKAGG